MTTDWYKKYLKRKDFQGDEDAPKLIERPWEMSFEEVARIGSLPQVRRPTSKDKPIGTIKTWLTSKDPTTQAEAGRDIMGEYAMPIAALGAAPSASALWSLAGKLPTAAKIATRVPLAPLYGLEQGVKKGLGLMAKGAEKAFSWTVNPVKKAYVEAETINTARVAATNVKTGQPFTSQPVPQAVTPEAQELLRRLAAEAKTLRSMGLSKDEIKSLEGMTLELRELHTNRARLMGFDKVAERDVDTFLNRMGKIAEARNDDRAIEVLQIAKDLKNAGNLKDSLIEAEQALGFLHQEELGLAKAVPIAPVEPRSKGVSAATESTIRAATPKTVVPITPDVTDEIITIATKSKNRREFVKEIIEVYDNPKRFFKQIRDRYGNVDNYMQVARNADLERRTTPLVSSAVSKLRGWIHSSREAWEPTKALRAKEAGKRAYQIGQAFDKFEGEEAFKVAYGSARGKMPIQAPKGLKLTNAESESLNNAIILAVRNNILQPFDSFTARSGIEKVLQHKLPAVSELVQLEKVFGGDLIETLLSKRSVWRRAFEQALDVVLLPRTLLASGDFSAPLRQGIWMLPSHPVKATQAFVKSVRMFFDPKYYADVVKSMAADPYAKFLMNGQLELTTLAKTAGGVLAREEAFASRLGDKIPILGAMVRASERAYTGYLDMFRLSTAKATIQGWGLKPTSALTEDVFKLTRYINWATGRGALPSGTAGQLLNALFFSPRLQTSRIGLPFLVAKMLISDSPALRKVAARDLVALLSAGGVALGLASLGGADVELDNRSADFGKARFGKTRIDLMGGFGQYAVLMGRLLHGGALEGEFKAASGRIRSANRLELLERFVRTKASPFVSQVVNLLAGKTVLGDELKFTQDALALDLRDNLLMMAWQDIWDAADEYGLRGGMMALPAVFGAGVQTYDSAPQLISEVRYFYSKGQAVNQKVRELEMKRDFLGAEKLRQNNEDVLFGQLVSGAYRTIEKLEQQKKQIELDPAFSDEARKEMLNMIEVQQIEIAVPALLAIDQHKLRGDAAKLKIPMSENNQNETMGWAEAKQKALRPD